MTLLQDYDIQTAQCGFIGIGTMGFQMAQRIHKQLVSVGGKPLLIYNRTASRAQDLKKHVPDIQIAESIKMLAQESDIVFTSLRGDDNVIQVVNELLNEEHGLEKKSIIVELSTVDPSIAEELANKAQQVYVHYIACPVTGPSAKAATGNLILTPAGDPTLLDKVILPQLIPAIGNKKVLRVGEKPHQALQFKLINNFFTRSLTETLATGMALAELTGTGKDNIKELMSELFPGTILARYAERMTRNTFKDEVQLSLTSAREDALRILSLVENKKNNQKEEQQDQFKLPTIESFLNHVDSVIKNHGNYDVLSIVLALQEEAGVNTEANGIKQN